MLIKAPEGKFFYYFSEKHNRYIGFESYERKSEVLSIPNPFFVIFSDHPGLNYLSQKCEPLEIINPINFEMFITEKDNREDITDYPSGLEENIRKIIEGA
jgi:hypothetical protein